MTTQKPAEIFPPGEFIREELEARGWTQADLAEIMGRPLRTVNEIVTGKKGITPETAVGLGQAFGTTAELWLNLEAAYRLSFINDRSDDVARRARIHGFAPVTDMIKRGWIEPSRSIDVLEKRIVGFFGVSSLDEEPQYALAARKSTSYSEATPGLVAWYFRARQLASSLKVATFTRSRFGACLEKLRLLAKDAEELRHLPKILAEAGIRFLVIEHLPGSKLDGAAFWLANKQPVIALSLRFDRIDWLWHTLGHELGHINHEDAASIDLDLTLTGDNADRPECEKLADEFAETLIIPKAELEDFIARIRPLFSKRKIVAFASRIGVHPGVVVGQLQHRGQIAWAHSREMLAKVRGIVTSVALTDGWGGQVRI